jgi:hypothetical protein
MDKKKWRRKYLRNSESLHVQGTVGTREDGTEVSWRGRCQVMEGTMGLSRCDNQPWEWTSIICCGLVALWIKIGLYTNILLPLEQTSCYLVNIFMKRLTCWANVVGQQYHELAWKWIFQSQSNVQITEAPASSLTATTEGTWNQFQIFDSQTLQDNKLLL